MSLRSGKSRERGAGQAYRPGNNDIIQVGVTLDAIRRVVHTAAVFEDESLDDLLIDDRDGDETEDRAPPLAMKTGSPKEKGRSNQGFRKRKQHLEEQHAHGITSPVKGCTWRHFANANIFKVAYKPNSLGQGYTGPPIRPSNDKVEAESVEQLVDELGMTLIEWNGIATTLIVDADGNIIVTLMGRPTGIGFTKVVEDLNAQFQTLSDELSSTRRVVKDRRGDHIAVSLGISYGGGQRQPGNLQVAPRTAQACMTVMNSPAMSRLVGFTDKKFQCIHPKLHTYYGRTLRRVQKNHLRQPFGHGVMACCTLNIPNGTRNCVTRRHADFKNLRAGDCIITAGGAYDHLSGGHLVLWDLGLVIQFPVGSSISLPSALLEHSNVPVAKGEVRWSFTQFTPAGLFRWVDNGHRSDISILSSKDPEAIRWMKDRHERVWTEITQLRGRTIKP